MDDVANIWMWVGFSIFLVIALCIDTVVHTKHASPHQSMRAAITWTLVWVLCALIFNFLLWWYLQANISLEVANKKALDFFTGYLIEKSLALDNLFVFFIIFHQLKLPPAAQQRVFTYGIWSAIVMRLVLIMVGTWLVTQFHWVLYVMGIFLLLTGVKMLVVGEKKKDVVETGLFQIIKSFCRVTSELVGQKFFIRKHGVLYATPLFVALIYIELSDLIFAFDSIPAIFAITTDPFIVWSSNIFAILGLRALYFLLAGVAERFHLLKYGIACILIFVGLKMVIEPWIHISVAVSLVIIVSTLFIFAVISYLEQRRNRS